MEASVWAWSGRSNQHANLRHRGYEAKWGMCFKQAAHDGFYAGMTETE